MRSKGKRCADTHLAQRKEKKSGPMWLDQRLEKDHK